MSYQSKRRAMDGQHIGKGESWKIFFVDNTSTVAKTSRLGVDGLEFGSLLSKTTYIPRAGVSSAPLALLLDFSVRDIQLFLDGHFCVEFLTREVENFVLVDSSDETTSIFLTLRHPPRVYDQATTTEALEFSRRCSSVDIDGSEDISREAFAFSRTVRLKLQSIAKVHTVIAFFAAVDKTIYEANIQVDLRESKLSIPLEIPAVTRHNDCWEVRYAWLCVTSAKGFVVERFDDAFWNELDCYTSSLATTMLYWIRRAMQNDLFLSPLNALEEARRRVYSLVDVQDSQLHCRIPRVIFSPTRILFYEPEIIQTNRVLREWGGSVQFLRVLIRDDSLAKLSITKGKLEHVLKEIVEAMKEDLHIGSRSFQFLGCSNNQVRDHGCFFVDVTRNRHVVTEIRDWVGNLDGMPNVAKYVARLGQVFSTSTNTVTVDSSECQRIPDIEENGYCFTDGIGMITPDLAEEVAMKLGTRGRAPCAFQIRFGGCKGVVAVDNNVQQTHPGKRIFYRNSMLKYWSQHRTIEVLAGCARPQALHLNQQLIMLLSHRGVPDSVFTRLLQDALTSLARMFIDEDVARNQLGSVQCGIDWSLLAKSQWRVTVDPYMRSMLMSLYRSRMKGLREKSRIPIDENDARVLIGTVDESRTLEYGQVFVQISQHTNNPGVERIILQRKVVIAKSPALHPGDLRTFDAVDCPALHHTCDCVVFPSKGKRPHPNELSGSDLDGDLYHVIWGDYLMPKLPIEEPMDYKADPARILDRPITSNEMLLFLRENIEHDCLGQIDNTHKALADQLGIGSQPCICLAYLHNQAVDAAKTGNWATVPYKIRRMLDKYPDFMMKADKPSYPTEKILGVMYRECTKFLNTCSSHKCTLNGVGIPLKHNFSRIDGVEAFLPEARKLRRQYNGKLMEIMDMYGIGTEAEVMTGFIGEIHEKMGKEHTDVTRLVSNIRDRLIDNYARLFKQDERVCQDGVILEDKAILKAAAWYHVCYSPAERAEQYAVGNASLFTYHSISADIDSAKSRIGRSIYDMLIATFPRLLVLFEDQLRTKNFMSNVLAKETSVELDAYLYGLSYMLLFDERQPEVELLFWFSGMERYLFQSTRLELAKKRELIHLAKHVLQNNRIDCKPVTIGGNLLIHFSFYVHEAGRTVKGHAALDPSFWFQSALLLEYIFHDPWLLPLLRVIVKWARATDFVGLFKHALVDSLSLCFMLVDYCIRNGAIANVIDSNEVLEDLKQGNFATYAKSTVWQEIVERLYETEPEGEPMGELLLGFFSDAELQNMKPIHLSLQPALGYTYYYQTCSMETIRLLHEEMQRAFHKLSFYCSIEPLFVQVEIEKVVHLPAEYAKHMIGSELFFARLISKTTRTSVEVHQRGDKTGGLLLRISGNNTGIHAVERQIEHFKTRSKDLDITQRSYPGVTELFVDNCHRCIIEGLTATNEKNVVLEDYWGARHPDDDYQGLYSLRVRSNREPIPQALYDMNSLKFAMFKKTFLERLALLRDTDIYSPFLHGPVSLRICFGRMYLISPSKDVMEDSEGISLTELQICQEKTGRYIIPDLKRWKQDLLQYKPKGDGRQHLGSRTGFFAKLNSAIPAPSLESVLKNEYGLKLTSDSHEFHLSLRGVTHGVLAEYDCDWQWTKVSYPPIRWMLLDVKRFNSERKGGDIRFDITSRAECHEEKIVSSVRDALRAGKNGGEAEVYPELFPRVDSLREIRCRKFVYLDIDCSQFWRQAQVVYNDVHVVSRPRLKSLTEFGSRERFLDLRVIVNLAPFASEMPSDAFIGEMWFQAVRLSDRLMDLVTGSQTDS